MTTEIVFKDGQCGFRNIRIKRWGSGFSIKCMKRKKTIVVRPYAEDHLQYDLITFCDSCKETKIED
jgi:hypothetical protein